MDCERGERILREKKETFVTLKKGGGYLEDGRDHHDEEDGWGRVIEGGRWVGTKDNDIYV